MLLSGMLLFLPACKQGQIQVQQDEPILVTLIHSGEVSASFPITTSGRLSSKAELKLSFKTGGIIESVNASEGSWVKKGMLLARLNTSEIAAQVAQAKSAFEKAQRDLQRAENLYNDSVATLEQLQNARTAVDLAQAYLKIAEFNLEYSSIRAPSGGKILKKLAEPNEMIAPGHPVFLFSSGETDWVLRTNLADVDIVRVKYGDKAIIRFDAFPGREFNAIVSEIASLSDVYTGTYEVELQISAATMQFKTGLIARGIIYPSEKKKYKTLPVDAVHDANDSDGMVYVAHGETFEKRQIEILHITDSLLFINGDIEITDSIIRDGASYLIPGSRISVID